MKNNNTVCTFHFEMRIKQEKKSHYPLVKISNFTDTELRKKYVQVEKLNNDHVSVINIMLKRKKILKHSIDIQSRK